MSALRAAPRNKKTGGRTALIVVAALAVVAVVIYFIVSALGNGGEQKPGGGDSQKPSGDGNKAVEQGRQAIEGGDYVGALRVLLPVKEEAEAKPLYEETAAMVYTEYVDKASVKIEAGDYTGAQEEITVLKEFFPDDWRVQNLVFSSTNIIPYDDYVEHIFFHPLIAYPERAFDGDAGAQGQDDYMTTVPEFNRTIEQLYAKDYILVNINNLFDIEFDANGAVTKVTKKPVMIPEGKKPIIISVDDINYYEYMKKDGQVFALTLDENGEIVTYSKDLEGNDVYSKENDVVPILDEFVKKHPDFSMNGAKGLLCLTGYEGVLGYRTDEPTWDGYEEQVKQATKVIEQLKKTGWVFGSHSQGHRHTSKITFDLFKNDTDRWAREVLPLIGPTAIYIYPFGEGVPPDDAKFKYMQQMGFGFFCTVSSNARISWGDDYGIQGRRNIDGIALRDKRLYDLIDSATVIDEVRPSYQKWLVWAKQNGYVK